MTLDEAYRQARILEQAQKQSASYDNNVVAAIQGDPPSTVASVVKRTPKEETCYFCENPRNPRSNCPARNSECHNCNKKGHWGKMCKSKTIASITNQNGNYPDLA